MDVISDGKRPELMHLSALEERLIKIIYWYYFYQRKKKQKKNNKKKQETKKQQQMLFITYWKVLAVP